MVDPATLFLILAAPFVGSFLGVLVLRLPEGRPVLLGRSACPHCGTVLGPRDLVPLVSWLLLRRRCRACGTAIPPFYPLIELAALGVALWAVATAPNAATATAGCLLGWALLALAEIDRALGLLRDATGSLQHREDADFAFHLAISKASNNQYFEATMRALREHINVGMKLHGQSLMSDGAKGLQDVLAEHTAIRDAIADGQAERAAELMRGHLEHSRDRLFGGGLIDLRMRK